MAYDIIGDIHGHAQTLELLLEELGYSLQQGVYRHPTRRVIFLGDFIDRGPQQRKVIHIVRPMIDAGAALSVMGNHEFNAIAYSTPKSGGGFLRPHNDHNFHQHQAFLDAYVDADDYHELLDWFGTLPLWLDLGDLRVVHACWDQDVIDEIKSRYDVNGKLSNGLLYAACNYGTWEFLAVETLLKGKEIKLPDGHSFTDQSGITRRNIRVRWWDDGVETFRDAFMGDERLRTNIPDDDIHGDHLIEYSHSAPPCFLGHYWLSNRPAPLSDNIACVDYSVARKGGQLAAYRWDGETVLSADKFVTVNAVEHAVATTV